VKLPEFVDVSDAVLREIARRHGVDGAGPFTRLPDTGIYNAHFLLGEHLVVRVPRDHPGHVAALRRETVAVPAVRKAGVRTPALIAFDDSRELLNSPYAIYERVSGQHLESLDLEPAALAGVWRDLGRDLARVHGITADDLGSPLPPPSTLPDPRTLVDNHASAGWFSSSEARWLMAWLERLAPTALTPTPSRFVHGDMQATNVMVRADPPTDLALIDWGSGAWGIAVDDLAVLPLSAVPFMLHGHRELAPLDDDANVEARIVWRHVQLALLLVPRGPLPGFSWAERPLSMLLEILGFFAADPPEPWRGLGPRARAT
jgi:aminoglycoside phosphotransferase (APT) family kinase protein